MELVITSRQNNLVKYIRSLRDKRTRENEKKIVIEGLKFVQEAVSSGKLPEKIIISPNSANQATVSDLLAKLGNTLQVFKVDDQVMDYMSETESPQGLMAVLDMPDLSLADISINPSSFVVVVDGVQDPGNVGTIIRTADAFGATAIILTRGCADIYNSKTLRSTMGSVFHIPVVRDIDISDLKSFLKEKGLFTAVTGLYDDAVSVSKANLDNPLCLVLGSEARGVTPEIMQVADIKLKIPMPGLAESLNVAVSAGVVLYEACSRRGSNGNQTCK